MRTGLPEDVGGERQPRKNSKSPLKNTPLLGCSLELFFWTRNLKQGIIASIKKELSPHGPLQESHDHYHQVNRPPWKLFLGNQLISSLPIWQIFILAPTMYQFSVHLAPNVLGAGDTTIPIPSCFLVSPFEGSNELLEMSLRHPGCP